MKRSYSLKILFFISIFPIVLFGQKVNDSIILNFNHSFNKESISKNKWYVSDKNDSIQFKKIIFYLTDFNLKKGLNDTKIAESNFLINAFENESSSINLPLENIFNKEIDSISFNIGVNENLNTDGALGGALDPEHGMYWSWQSGYINFKIEGISPSCNTRKNKFQFHIGGYKSPFPTIQRVTFGPKSQQGNTIDFEVDLAILFNSINLKETNQVMTPGKEAKTIADQLPNLFSVK